MGPSAANAHTDTQTHTDTHRHTYTHTHAHTEMPALFCTFRIDLMSMFAAHTCALV